jgi:acetyl esterase/lipase
VGRRRMLKAGALAIAAAPILGARSVRSVLGDSGAAGRGSAGTVQRPGAGAGSIRVYQDVRYATHTDPLYGDLYVPKGPARRPGVLVLHGGGFDSGDKSSMSRYAEDIAELGFVVFNANYRYSPPYPKEAPMEDAETALDWLRRRSFVLPRRVGVLGASAGATMALAMATYGMVRAAVSWSGACEKLTPAVTGVSSPCYLAHSTDDPVVPVKDAEDMAAALRDADVPCRFDRLPGEAHGIALGKNRRVDLGTSTWLQTRLAGSD